MHVMSSVCFEKAEHNGRQPVLVARVVSRSGGRELWDTLPVQGEQIVPFNRSSQSYTSLPHPFPLISAIPLEGIKHSQVRSLSQQEEASRYPNDHGLVLSILFLLLICFDCGKATGKD